MKTKKYILIALLVLTPAFLSAQTIESNEYIVWGIGNDQIAIPAGSVITEAVLTIQNVTPQDTPLYVHLLDNAEKGLQVGIDEGSGDFFDSYGVLLSGTYENGNYVCRFSQNENSQSPIRATFPSPTSVTLADSTTVQLSSALLELMDYAGNGGGLGFGIKAVNNIQLQISSLKLEITIQSYQTVASSVLTFLYDLDLLISPTARWTLDDNADSTVVADSGGAGLTGSAFRNTALLSAAGVINDALEFNGVSDYVQVSPNTAINQYGRSSFAISAWIYPHSTGEGGDGRILCKRSTGYDFYLTGTNAIAVYIPHTTKAAWRTSTSNAIELNTWQHVAFVYNEDGDQTVKLYVNGVLQDGGQNIAGQGDLSDDRQKSLVIGRLSTSDIRQFDGFIDDIRIYGQAITPSQIEKMCAKYNKFDLNWLNSNLVARWTLDDNANSTVVADSGGAGLTGSAFRNTALLSAAGVINDALEFNGVSDYVQVSPNTAINQYGRSSFAISAWIYPHSTGEGGDGRILCKRSTGYDFYLTGTNAIAVYIPHTTKAAWRTSTSNAIELNTWQHVAFVYNEDGDQTVKLYVNGVLQDGGQNIAGQGDLSDDRQKSLVIGRLSTSDIRQFDGFIDDIRIYGQAITSSQIGLLCQ